MLRETLHFGNGVLQGDLLRNCCAEFGVRTVIIADRKVPGAALLAERISADLLFVSGGEKVKTRGMKERIEDELFRLGCGRDTVLAALGGGSVTDLVGFVASTYLRGIPLVLIPTTLLAMVDAAIGGKTAINLPWGKNLLGSFYPPRAIFADPDFLKTLPQEERNNGLAEILKMGLVYDPLLCEDPSQILRAMQKKREIVEQDPLETGIRRILNFGHTIGHALEATGSISHGKAVALGSLVEAHLSMRLAGLSQDRFEAICRLYDGMELSLPDGYERGKFMQALSFDKKKERGAVRFVLIDAIGHAIPFDGSYCRAVSEEELLPSLVWMERKDG